MTARGRDKIIIIRRDNIGDLVCTTPLIHRVRQQYPSSRLFLFCNSYNAPIVKNHPDIDRVYFYTKMKHVSGALAKIKALLHTIATVIKLRWQKIDIALIASPGGTKYAKLIGAKKIICKPDCGPEPMHEVESCLTLIGAQADESQDKLRVIADTKVADRLFAAHPLPAASGKRIGVQISARRVLQQWSVENFVALIERLSRQGMQVLLFWSPGSADNLQHPGDDEKMAAIVEGVATECRQNTFPVPTQRLEELIAGLSACDAVICPDGGAMHVAAGLGKPLVALFGDVTTVHWRPWGVPNILLKAERTGCVAELTPDQVTEALLELIHQS